MWILITPTLFILLGLFLFDRYFAPTLLNLIIQKVEDISKKEGPLLVKINTAELTYFPIGLKTGQIQLIPKKNLIEQISTISIQQVKLELALFAFVTGKLKVGNLTLEAPQLEVFLKLKDKTSAEKSQNLNLNWSPLFEILEIIPVEQLSVNNMKLDLVDGGSRKSVRLHPLDLQVLKLPELVQLKISAPEVYPSWDQNQVLKTGLQFSATLTPKEFRVQQLLIENKTLNFNLSGQVKASKNSKKLNTQVYWKSSLELEAFQESFKIILPQHRLPRITGRVEAEGNWEPQNEDLFNSKFKIKTSLVSLADFRLGSADIKGSFSKDQLSLDEIHLDHPAGHVVLNNTAVSLNSNLNFETQIKIQELNFTSLFKSIKLPNVPVQGMAVGQAPCSGKLVELEVQCEFNARVKQFSVKAGAGKSDFEIVGLDEISAEGKLNLDLEKIKYDSRLSMKNSKGKSQGTILFKEGFKIQYNAEQLDWNDVRNLASLSIKGSSKLSGSTEGDSRSAIFDIDLEGKNQSLAGFYLGDVKSDIKYSAGILSLPNLNLKVENSPAEAQLKINLVESKIEGTLKSEQIDLAHIKKILEVPIPIPISLAGTGTVKAQFSGPLDFWNLDIDLESKIQQPQIAGEIFNDLIFNVTSRNGVFQISQLSTRRGSTEVGITGTVGPEKNLNLQGTLQNGKLEESDIISRIGWPLSGDINAQLKLTGKISRPELTLNGQIAEMILDENQVSNSSFKISIEKNQADLEGQFFGNQVQSKIRWPTGQDKTPVQFRFKSQNWDFTPWLSLFNAGAINEETQGSLTSDINLESEEGDWGQLSGTLKFDSLSLTRQSLTLANSSPLLIQTQKGFYQTSNFLLTDQNGGQLKLSLQDSSLNSLNMDIEAETDIKLLQIFIPLFEEISGQIRLNAKVTGPLVQPLSVGELKLNNAYFKLKNFPHAFEKVSLESTFSQSRLLINEIQGQLGGGLLRGEGSLQFQGPGDIPVFIRIKAQDISLNIPTGVKTRGDADISFTGRKFPYLLGVNYRIKSNLVEMNFGNEQNNATKRRNEYLPQNLKEQIQEPIELDLQLTLEKPLMIKNSLLDAQASGNLSVKGYPSNPILIGQLKSLKGSQLFFKDKPFQIQSANIQFSDPLKINPELYISAQTRVDIYDITLLIQGTASDPTIRLSSVPPLSDNDLTSLLALGVTSSKLAEVKSETQQDQTVNEVFAAAFQSTGLSKKVQSVTGFNVQLSNSFDTTRNISVPKFTVSRKINKRTNATVAFPVTGDQKTPEGKIQYNITDTFSINGSYETRKFDQNSTNIEQREIPSILGVDLEFSREFK
ncbi:MAG: translocation/assembly module TamB domain-containing protein [Bdellovibrionales bacterium]